MKRALIIVQNKNSTLKNLVKKLQNFSLIEGYPSELIPINSFEPKKLEGTDYLLLSGWRNGSLFSRTDNEWISFVKRLPTLNGIKTPLFATYKIFPGGMFRKTIGRACERFHIEHVWDHAVAIWIEVLR